MTSQRIEYLAGNEPYWGTSDGKPPPDTPPCGFFNEKCPESTFCKFFLREGRGEILAPLKSEFAYHQPYTYF